MKFKVKPEKSNFVLMTSMFIMSLIVCILFLVLHEYIYSLIYFILILVISHIYYFTYYYLKDNGLIIRLGFIRIKFNYKNILDVNEISEKVRIKLKNITLNIYPNNREIFISKLKSYLTNESSYNIIK